MKYLQNPCTNPYYNMAFDEYCLEQLSLDEPLFYLWQNQPAVIIGLNQNPYQEVNLPYIEEQHIQLARRVTGGGAVYHDWGNLNYTLVGRSTDLDRDFPGYAQYMVDALRALGLQAEFTGRNDVLVEGRKVSGCAKRVYHDRLMVHGTLMYDVNLEVLEKALSAPGSKMQAKGIASVRSKVTNLREHLPEITSVEVLKNKLEALLSNGYSDAKLQLEEAQLSDIRRIAEEKFASWDWIWGRSPVATCTNCRKWVCGTVEVHFSIEKGCLAALTFGGDFLGNRNVQELQQLLLGCRYQQEALAARLQEVPIHQYFDCVSAAQLVQLLMDGAQ